MVAPFNMITTLVALNIASHPWSQSTPTLISALDASFGKRCACVAVVGNAGIGSCAVCVDVMMSPFGISTLIGVVVG